MTDDDSLLANLHDRIELRLTMVYLLVLIQSAAEAVTPALREYNLTFSVSLPTRPVWVFVDADRVQQVLMYLLMRAAKSTPPGGTIMLDASACHARVVAIAVRHSGPMVGTSDLSAFAGLTAARRVIERHQGALEARTAGAHHGSEFIVTLPATACD